MKVMADFGDKEVSHEEHAADRYGCPGVGGLGQVLRHLPVHIKPETNDTYCLIGSGTGIHYHKGSVLSPCAVKKCITPS